jgi:hypothetical protein
MEKGANNLFKRIAKTTSTEEQVVIAKAGEMLMSGLMNGLQLILQTEYDRNRAKQLVSSLHNSQTSTYEF